MAKLKIANMEPGNTYECPLAVASASSRTTKTGKPYLTMELFDGTEAITCNYWSWSGESMPKQNTVYNFKVECSMYMGHKQLTCRKVTANTTDLLEDFMPQGPKDVAQCFQDAYAMISDLEDDFFRVLGLGLFENLQAQWLHVPGAKSIHHAYMGGTLVHSLSVARLAKAMAEQTDDAWVDLCVIGGLLHDIGKLFTYELNGLAIDYTEEGQLFDHIFIGANLVGNYAFEDNLVYNEFDELKLQMLQHIILSHHMKKEFGSPVTPRCIEAWIVAHADGLDAVCEAIRTSAAKVGEERFTEPIWSAGNLSHFTPQAMTALSNKKHIVGLTVPEDSCGEEQ